MTNLEQTHVLLAYGQFHSLVLRYYSLFETNKFQTVITVIRYRVLEVITSNTIAKNTTSANCSSIK